MQTLCGHVDKPLARLAHIPTQPYYQALLSMLVSTRNDEGPNETMQESRQIRNEIAERIIEVLGTAASQINS